MLLALLRLAALAAALAAPAAARAETLRVATYDVGLSRDGAGLLLRDLGRERDAALSGVLAVIREVRPDVLLLTGFDHDLNWRALDAFRALLRDGPGGIDYPHAFSAPVNAGVPSGLDLDGDGLVMGRDDAFGWGAFPGHGGMAVLSRLPLETDAARSFRTLPWAALPRAEQPTWPDGRPWPDAQAAAARRLSSRSHWDLPVALPGGGRLHLLASNPTPPLFDGPERRNALRNRDELRFWQAYLDGAALPDDSGRAGGAPEAPLVLLGNLNRDPADGAGLDAGPDGELDGGLDGLLRHERLQDPLPASEGGAAAANAGHRGPPELDTADWRDEDGPGNLRVDYVLPDARLSVRAAGVFWPAPGAPLAAEAEAASAHRLVWVDIDLP
jgi:Endonuclease/Exonuclease/phosphatase family